MRNIRYYLWLWFGRYPKTNETAFLFPWRKEHGRWPGMMR